MKRDEKVKLLNDLWGGKADIATVFPVLPEYWVYEKGSYFRGNKELSESDFTALTKKKGKNWLFSIFKFNALKPGRIEISGNCEGYKWPFDARPPLDESQVKKILNLLKSNAEQKQL